MADLSGATDDPNSTEQRVALEHAIANELSIKLVANLQKAGYALVVNDLPLDALTETVTPPEDVFSRGLFRFAEHPTGHSVLPTAAT